MTGEPTIWKIAIRDEIRARMVTNPEPYWASTESERDWVLEHQLHRPREDYVAVEVPGPVGRAIEDEAVRWARVRAELRERGRAGTSGDTP